MILLVIGCAPHSLNSTQQQCPVIRDSFDLDYIPDSEKQFPVRLIDFLNSESSPTPVATLSITSASETAHAKIEVRDRRDITNDNMPETFLSATHLPEDETDLVGVWTDYLIISCTTGQFRPIFVGGYQNIYHRYTAAVVGDVNQNDLPEVMITDVNTHWVTITSTMTLEWNGNELAILEENTVYGPTETPAP
jgi:hypothetical protein